MRCTYAGSLRRMRETIGDVDVLAVAEDSGPLMAAFAGLPDVAEVIARGDRLDLNDAHILRAKRHGVTFAINSDAHSTVHLGYLRYGVGMAQRGWLTADDVINTWPLTKLRRFLRKGG